jgi:hypothetical protein
MSEGRVGKGAEGAAGGAPSEAPMGARRVGR